jgi:hypothetical protein
MERQRLTRWERARQDWSGVRARRDTINGLIGSAVAAIVLDLVGAGAAAQILFVVSGATTLVAFLLAPGAELGFRWLQVPKREMAEDLQTLLAEVEAMRRDMATDDVGAIGVRWTGWPTASATNQAAGAGRR